MATRRAGLTPGLIGRLQIRRDLEQATEFVPVLEYPI